MFALVICRSGECRVWSSVRPQLSQLPDAAGAAPTAGRGARRREHQGRGDGSDEDSHDERSLHALLHLPERRGRVSRDAAARRPEQKCERQQASRGEVRGERNRVRPDALRGGRRRSRARCARGPPRRPARPRRSSLPPAAAASRSSSRRLSSCGKYAASGCPSGGRRARPTSRSGRGPARRRSRRGAHARPRRRRTSATRRPSARTGACGARTRSKYPCVTSSASGASVVALTFTSCGGGRSIPTARSTVASNAAVSAIGSRFGSARSVSVPTPAGTSEIAARSWTAAACARARRLGAPGPRGREHRPRRVEDEHRLRRPSGRRAVSVARSAGCAAASPSSTRHGCERDDRPRAARRRGAARAEAARARPRPSLGEHERGERQRRRPARAAPPSGVRNVRLVVPVNTPAPAYRFPRRAVRCPAGPVRGSARALSLGLEQAEQQLEVVLRRGVRRDRAGRRCRTRRGSARPASRAVRSSSR